MISARNRLNVEITGVKTGSVNSLVSAKTAGGEVLKATVTTESEINLSLKAGANAVFLVKASSIIIQKGDDGLKLSAANQLKSKVLSVKEGAVNADIELQSAGGERLSAIITMESLKNMALRAGDDVTAIIKATQIIVGVKA